MTSILLRGYNRWARHWPPQIAAKRRWPGFMLKTGAFAYEYRVERTFASEIWPRDRPSSMVATFDPNWLFGGFAWLVTPPPHEFGQLCWMVFDYFGDFDEIQVGWRFVLTPFFGNEFESEEVYQTLGPPFDLDYSFQTEDFDLSIWDKDFTIFDGARYRFSIPEKCGEEWPLE